MFYITIILMSAVLWHLKEGKLELNKYLFISFCSITFFTQQCDFNSEAVHKGCE